MNHGHPLVGTVEEAEILHVDVRLVSSGMGKGWFFYRHQEVSPAHGTKGGELGCMAKDQHRLARVCP